MRLQERKGLGTQDQNGTQFAEKDSKNEEGMGQRKEREIMSMSLWHWVYAVFSLK